jgi:hypothetical protein
VDSGIEWDVQVAAQGEQISPLAIDEGGARFELWTIRQQPLTPYLLDTKYVGSYIPQGWISIRTEDPYATIPRTRADRPFEVVVRVEGMLDDPTAPEAAREVTLQHFAQAYAPGGDGVDIDRNQAVRLAAGRIASNGEHVFQFGLTALPGADRTKLRGEERFTLESLPDGPVPPLPISSQFVQIWPVADAMIEGVSWDQQIRFALPELTFRFNDLYPDSRSWAHVYQGAARLGQTGNAVPGSLVVINDNAPQSRTVTIQDWDDAVPVDGLWTLELLTETPFGTERLAHVSFHVDRTIEVNTTLVDME